MSVKRGADVVVESIKAYGADLIAGFIGHTTHEVADAVGKAGIRTINPATELGGSYMLNAYNYLKNRPAGVGIWHNVGSLLIHPALMEARSSRIPVVHFGLNSDGRLSGRDGAIQQVPVAAFAPVTRFSQRVERVDKLGEAIHEAFHAAQGVPSGSAYLDVPFDLTVDKCEAVVPQGYKMADAAVWASVDSVRKATEELLAAKRPIIVVGGGVARNDGGAAVQALAELAGIPFVTTTTAQGVISEEHPLSMGPVGMCGWRCANETLAEADFALVLGSRLADWGVAQGFIAKIPPMVQVDTDPAQLGRFYFSRLSIVADAGTFARQLLEVLAHHKAFVAVPFQDREIVRRASERKKAWRHWVDSKGENYQFPLSKWRVVRELRSILGPEDIVVTDIGAHSGPLMCGAIMRKPRRLLLSFGEGILGSGFPMGIGAKLAEPSRTVVVGTGDGSFQYHFNELRVAVEQKLPMIVLIFNDGVYGANDGMMKHWYGAAQWTQFTNPNWVGIAKAYGAEGERIEHTDELGAALRRGKAANKPYVIDIPVDPMEGPPEVGAVGPAFLLKPRVIPPDINGSLLAGEHLL